MQVQYVSASITDETALTSATARATDARAGRPPGGLPWRGSRVVSAHVSGRVRALDGAKLRGHASRHQGRRAVDGRAQVGSIVIIGSALSVVAFMGYSTYAPAKHALRGLADTLRNELVGFGVTVHFAYPPDTATPGFEHENQSKFYRTVDGAIDVFPAEQVADQLVGGVEAGLYHLPSPDLVINWMVSSRAGVSPRAYPFVSRRCSLASLIEAAACCTLTCGGGDARGGARSEGARKVRGEGGNARDGDTRAG